MDRLGVYTIPARFSYFSGRQRSARFGYFLVLYRTFREDREAKTDRPPPQRKIERFSLKNCLELSVGGQYVAVGLGFGILPLYLIYLRPPANQIVPRLDFWKQILQSAILGS
jgi:hypothetical protein